MPKMDADRYQNGFVGIKDKHSFIEKFDWSSRKSPLKSDGLDQLPARVPLHDTINMKTKEIEPLVQRKAMLFDAATAFKVHFPARRYPVIGNAERRIAPQTLEYRRGHFKFNLMGAIGTWGLALLLVLVTSAAGAGDCWVASVENRTTGYGDLTSAKRYAELKASLLKTDEILKADPAINALQNVRYQVHRYIGVPYHPGAPLSGKAAVYLHKPEMWLGHCGLKSGSDIVHFVEFEVNLNNLRSLEEQATDEGSQNSTKFVLQPKEFARQDGYMIFENRAGNQVLVMTAGNLPPFVPVTVGEYLDHWHRLLTQERQASSTNMPGSADDVEWRKYVAKLKESDPMTAAELQKNMDDAARPANGGAVVSNAEWDELRRLRATLTQAQRAKQVYLTSDAVERFRFGYAQMGDEGAIGLVKVNAALWAGQRHQSEIRVVTLEVLVQDQESTRQSRADRWLERVDVRPYRGLLTSVKND